MARLVIDDIHYEPRVKLNVTVERHRMRVTYNIELKVDVLVTEAERHATFTELVIRTAR